MSDLLISKGDVFFLTTLDVLKKFILDNYPPPNIDFLDLTLRLYESYPQSVNLGDFLNNSVYSDIEIRLIYRLKDMGNRGLDPFRVAKKILHFDRKSVFSQYHIYSDKNRKRTSAEYNA